MMLPQAFSASPKVRISNFARLSECTRVSNEVWELSVGVARDKLLRLAGFRKDMAFYLTDIGAIYVDAD